MCLVVISTPNFRENQAQNREDDSASCGLLFNQQFPTGCNSNGFERGKVGAALPMRIYLKSPCLKKCCI